jgi:hypothetical protein
MDAIGVDRDVLWVWLDGGMARKMVHASDGIQLKLKRPSKPVQHETLPQACTLARACAAWPGLPVLSCRELGTRRGRKEISIEEGDWRHAR